MIEFVIGMLPIYSPFLRRGNAAQMHPESAELLQRQLPSRAFLIILLAITLAILSRPADSLHLLPDPSRPATIFTKIIERQRRGIPQAARAVSPHLGAGVAVVAIASLRVDKGFSKTVAFLVGTTNSHLINPSILSIYQSIVLVCFGRKAKFKYQKST